MGYLISMGITRFVAGALEEFGWRSFAQLRLQQRYGAVAASVVVGLVWVLWHLPQILAGVGDFPPLYAYVPEAVAFSLVLDWLSNATDGGLPAVMVTHAAHNRPDLLGVPGEMPVLAESVPWDAVFYVLVVAIVAWKTGARTLSGDRTLPAVPRTAGGPAAASDTPAASQ